MSQPKSLFGPLFLIAAGVIWLLVKSGNIASSNLWALTHVWPYVLIAAGIGLILRAYWQYANLLMDVVIVIGVVLAIVFAPRLGWDHPSMISMIGNGEFYVGPSEPGSGTVITETRAVADFTGIELSYPARVTITQGESASLRIEAEDNLLPGLQTRVRNGQLEIFYDVDNGKHVNPTKMVQINIVVKDLNEVDFSSAGELNIDGLETDELDISVSGAGSLDVNDLTTKQLTVNLSGAGSVTMSGTADQVDLSISGFGSFNGKDLQSQTASVALSGAGSATVWVEEKLDAHVSGVGSVNYYGSPQVSQQISGVGNVSRSGDK